MKLYAGVDLHSNNSDVDWLAEMLRLNVLPEGYIYQFCPKKSVQSEI